MIQFANSTPLRKIKISCGLNRNVGFKPNFISFFSFALKSLAHLRIVWLGFCIFAFITNMQNSTSMIRPCTCFILVALLQLIAPSHGQAHTDSTNQKPNIVLILADDLGISDLACYGNEFMQTPALNKLAVSGMLFENAYAAAPVCSPTRAAIMTGKSPARLKLTNYLYGMRFDSLSNMIPAAYVPQLPLEENTLAERLKEIGYITGMFGKWHLSDNEHESEFSPKNQGFDVVVGGRGSAGQYFFPAWQKSGRTEMIDGTDGEYLTDRLTDEAIAFVAQHKDEPFFLYLAHYAVHIPLQAKDEDIKKYQSLESHDAYNLTYAAMVDNLDQNTDRLIQALEANGLTKNTIIIFCSDNGGLAVPEGGPQPTTNEPYREGKGYLYEGGIRVPMLLSWPGTIQAGTKSDALVSSADIFVSLIDVVGAYDSQEKFDGRSLLPLWKEGKALENTSLYWHYPHFSNQGGRPSAAMREGNYKLLYFFETNSVELYDLKKDPGELNNIARNKARVAAKLKKDLLNWLKETEANLPQTVSE